MFDYYKIIYVAIKHINYFGQYIHIKIKKYLI